jgi:ketosteroid isomerase-like protein
MLDPIKPPAARRPEEALELVSQALSDGDLEAALAQYEGQALLSCWPQLARRGDGDIRGALASFMALRLPLSVRITTVLQTPELALVICERRVAGTSPDGDPVRLGGPGCAVLRPQPDGSWRIAADAWHLGPELLPVPPGMARLSDVPDPGAGWAPARDLSRARDTSSSCEDDQVSSAARDVDPGRLAHWCAEHLGSPPAGEVFRSGYLSTVIGFRLADDRAVVVKVRPGSPRVAACVEVQRRLFESGYPCPEPLTGAAPFGDDVATAETYVPGGAMLPSADRAAWAFAEALARLVRLAPRPAEVSTLDPAPSWAAWDHAEAGLWPRPEDSDVNLNEVAGPGWIDDAGRRARDRLQAGPSEAVIGHCDWLASNLRWSGDDLLVVHDWDSAIADSEAVLAGFAAALYPTVSPHKLATVKETEQFLAAYGEARGRQFSADELQRSWAAGVWTRACDAKYQHAVGQRVVSLSEHEARERLRRAGTG